MAHNAYAKFLYKEIAYVSRNEAVNAALRANDLDPEIKLVFGEDVYGKIDWSKEPSTPLLELYAQRARQLREKYDYLILMFSGGVDSSNMVDAFVNNGIHIDEIQSYWPLSVAEKLVPDANNVYHELGETFEYKLAALPRLQQLKKLIPKTFINIVDTTQYLRDNFNEEFLAKRIEEIRDFPTLYPTLNQYCMADYCVRRGEALGHRSVGAIFGAERPRPYIKNNELMFKFMEYGFSGSYSTVYKEIQGNEWYTSDLFYWTPELPEITIKQMHLIKKAMESDPVLYNSIANPEKRKSPGRFRLLQDYLTNKIIYPHWSNKIYQKAVKGQAEKILTYVLPEVKHVNNEGLRNGTLFSPFVDSILDKKTKYKMEKYKPMKGRSKIKIRRVLNSSYYDTYSEVSATEYSVGPIKRKIGNV